MKQRMNVWEGSTPEAFKIMSEFEKYVEPLLVEPVKIRALQINEMYEHVREYFS